jgi:hypothetical protein
MDDQQAEAMDLFEELKPKLSRQQIQKIQRLFDRFSKAYEQDNDGLCLDLLEDINSTLKNFQNPGPRYQLDPHCPLVHLNCKVDTSASWTKEQLELALAGLGATWADCFDNTSKAWGQHHRFESSLWFQDTKLSIAVFLAKNSEGTYNAGTLAWLMGTAKNESQALSDFVSYINGIVAK